MSEAPEEKSNQTAAGEPYPKTPETDAPLKQIRTFQGDVAEALEKQNESLFSIQKAEKTREENTQTKIPATKTTVDSKKQLFLLIIGALFFLSLGGLGAWYAYNEYKEKTAPPVVIAPESRLIASENSSEINLVGRNRDYLISEVEAMVSASSTGLTHIVLKNGLGLASTTQFFKLIESKAPGSLVRALKPVFMMGIVDGKRFLIFELTSFENAFGGMLTWEKLMPEELGPVFGKREVLKAITPESVFKDVIFKNKDSRAIYAGEEMVVLYSFYENRVLIVTESLQTLETLIDRLSREELVQ